MDTGYFTDGGREYVITTPRSTLRPWTNYSFNENYYINCDQFGRSLAQYQDGKGNWSIVTMRKTEYWFDSNKGTYVRDRDTGDYWDVGWIHTQRDFDDFRTRVRPGSTIIETQYRDIKMSWRIFVPVSDSVELWSLSVQNTGTKTRRLSLFPFAQLDLTGFTFPDGSGSGDYNSFLVGTILKAQNCSMVNREETTWLPPCNSTAKSAPVRIMI